MRLAVLFILLLLASCVAFAATITGKVVGVADGDTFTLLTAENRQVKIRLHGIDCPEKAQPFGTRAKQYTSELVFGKQVRVEITDTDRYGRIIAIVYAGRTNLNESLLLAGYAWHYARYDHNAAWASLEQQARRNKAGLWVDINAIAPWDWRKARR